MPFDSRLPWSLFQQDQVKLLSLDLPGVYVIFNYSSDISGFLRITVLYVGESADVQERLLAHLAGSGSPTLCLYTCSTTCFVVEPWANLGERLCREENLIAEYRPPCNVQGMNSPTTGLDAYLSNLALIPSLPLPESNSIAELLAAASNPFNPNPFNSKSAPYGGKFGGLAGALHELWSPGAGPPF